MTASWSVGERVRATETVAWELHAAGMPLRDALRQIRTMDDDDLGYALAHSRRLLGFVSLPVCRLT